MVRGPGSEPALSGGRRLVRVAALGGSTYALAVGAHVVGGGGRPGWAVSAALVAVLGVLAVGFTARRRRLPALVGALGGTQVLLHLLLTQVDLRGAAAACTTTSPTGLHVHTATLTCSPSAAPGAASVAGAMLLAHAAATVATAWLLARGEAWLWRVVDRVLARPGRLRPRATSRAYASVLPARPRTVARWCVADPRGPPRPVLSRT